MPTRDPVTSDAGYAKLLDDISRLYDATEVQMINAKVKFCWQTGRWIVLFEQRGQARAVRNKSLLEKLSADLTRKYGAGFSVDNLERMRRLYLAYPYSAPARNMTWTNYAELLKIDDVKKREALARRIEKEGLTKQDVRALVRRPKPVGSLPPLKRPTDLRLDTYARSGVSAKLLEGATLIDCGFFLSHYFTPAELKEVTLTDTPAYTYAAVVERVIDGDTLKVVIDIPGRNVVNEKLRLRGVNTPEMGTPEGERAKKFVSGLLPVGSVIVLKSHKSGIDLHGRFVVDIFYRQGCNDAPGIIADGVYLNQQLLDEGYAVRMEE
jgi:endonuclease YncB( thermonuclease family)